MFQEFAFIRRACLAVNLICATFNSPTNRSLPPPAPRPAANHRDVRPAARPAYQAVSKPHDRNLVPTGNGSRLDHRGWPFDSGGAQPDLTGGANNP